VTRIDYFPFGETTAGLTGDPKKFLGQEQDSDTAFRCLVLISQHRNVRVRVVAEKVLSAASMAGGLDEDVLAQVSIALRTVAPAAGQGAQLGRAG